MAVAASLKTSLKERLIICCDGTWNNSVSTDNPLTNVSRLSRCIDDVSTDGTPQIIYYHTGIGSGTSRFSNTVDATTGRGMTYVIKNLYSFICLNANHPEDEIFLIGFSRGAYTVQRLASLITHCGLLGKAGLGQINDLYKRFTKWESLTDPNKLAFAETERYFHNLRTNIIIEVCAVWDTVSALGIPASIVEAPVDFLFGNLHKTVHSETVLPRLKNVFHAVALNEERKDYKPILWAGLPETTNVRQCWFLGSHSDIGGGYEQCELANITLIWMVAQLRKYTKLAISDEYLKQYFHPTGLSNPKDNGFLVHQDTSTNSAAPSIAPNSEKPGPAVRKGLIHRSFKGIFALGSMAFRAPGGFKKKRKMSRQRTDDVREQHPDHRQDPATDGTAHQTIHSSVRVLTKDDTAHSYVMEARKTEILLQEDNSLDTEYRVIWRCFSREGWANRLEAWCLRHELNVNNEEEVFEDHMCDEEVYLVELWIAVLESFVEDRFKVNHHESRGSTGEDEPTSAGISAQNIAVADDNEAERSAKIEEKKRKGLHLGWKRSERPPGRTIRDLLRVLIGEAHEPTSAWMYFPPDVREF